MNIAIIGAGNVGGTLAVALGKQGHAVALGVRTPEKTPGAVSIAQAVAGADVIILATPFAALAEVVKETGPMAGKVVIDATNPLLPGLALAVGHSDSGGEALQRLVPTAKVVKCFNTVGVEIMANPNVGGHAATMFLCGDDAGARGTAFTLARDLGFEALDVGPLKNARLLEPAAVLWIHLAMVEKLGRRIALRLEGDGARAAQISASSPAHRVAVIGAGNIGGGLVRAWAKAGHHVTIGARAPGDAEVQALAKGAGARAATPAEAIAASDVVVLALPPRLSRHCCPPSTSQARCSSIARTTSGRASA
jgi:predicted dinucleotide-binding enzyme